MKTVRVKRVKGHSERVENYNKSTKKPKQCSEMAESARQKGKTGRQINREKIEARNRQTEKKTARTDNQKREWSERSER